MPDPISPLVAADVDLRNFTFMPLDVLRLRDSDLAAVVSGDAFRAAVLLWCAAWHQVPAASVPNDYRSLARLAGFGRDVAEWQVVKEEALRGFVKCTDGRLYHPVIADKANEAWRAKDAQRSRTAAATAARAAKQSAGRDVARHDAPDEQRDVEPDNARDVERNVHQGRGEERKEEDSSSPRSDNLQSLDLLAELEKPAKPPKPGRKHPYPDNAFELWYAAYPRKVAKAAAAAAFAKVFKGDAVAFETLTIGVATYVRTKPDYQDWKHPAAWLNGKRWEDEWEARPPGAALVDERELKVDLNGVKAPYSAVRNAVVSKRWPSPWGPKPGEPGCRIPPETISIIMSGVAA